MNQEAVNYIKGRITSAESSVTGDIETTYKATLDSGLVIEGKSIRPIDGFQQEEAQNAAFNDAVGVLYAGVDFILSKK